MAKKFGPSDKSTLQWPKTPLYLCSDATASHYMVRKMNKTTKTPAAKATREDRASVMVAAHVFFKKTGLPWSVCQLAAWENWRTKKFEELRIAQEAADAANGSMADKALYAVVADPYRLKDETRRLAANGAWWIVYEAMRMKSAA
jgi:hypothetical protein